MTELKLICLLSLGS